LRNTDLGNNKLKNKKQLHFLKLFSIYIIIYPSNYVTMEHFQLFLSTSSQVDGLSDDTKMETQRDIHQRATDELAENELETQIHLTFYLVSWQLCLDCNYLKLTSHKGPVE
jgi:hypothetical protein